MMMPSVVMVFTETIWCNKGFEIFIFLTDYARATNGRAL